MNEIMGKNGLPIRKGCMIFAGPDNPHEPAHWAYWVVNPELGHLVCWNANNIYHRDPEELKDYWVGEWRQLPQQEWFKEHFSSVGETTLTGSGVCAGVEDGRF